MGDDGNQRPRPRTTLVVPYFNEAAQLSPTAFVRCAAREPELRFLFVDDGSDDGTSTLLDALCRQDPTRFESIALPDNRDQDETVRRGILHALARGDEYVGFWDADLTAPLSEIPRFIA